MDLIKELYNSPQLNEGYFKAKLADATHSVVKKVFDKDLPMNKLFDAAIKELQKSQDMSKDEAEDQTTRDMLANSFDDMIDSIIQAKIWTEQAEFDKNKDEILQTIYGMMRKLPVVKHLDNNDLMTRIKIAAKYTNRMPMREEHHGEGLDGLDQALQNAKSEMNMLYRDDALSDEAASTWRMILGNLLKAVRKEDVSEFKKLYHEYAKGYPDEFEAIMDTVYGYLGVSTFEELAKKTLHEAVAPVKADEFELEVDFDQVHLLDGEKTVRVSMPLKVWLKLARQSISRYG